MPFSDPEKKKEYMKKYDKHYREKNKEYYKQYYRQYMKEYINTSKGKKVTRISSWKTQGIIFHDYDLLYDIYIHTTHCDYCKCELDKCNKSRKCLDHDHSTTDIENVRGILCFHCNVKDVLH